MPWSQSKANANSSAPRPTADQVGGLERRLCQCSPAHTEFVFRSHFSVFCCRSMAPSAVQRTLSAASIAVISPFVRSPSHRLGAAAKLRGCALTGFSHMRRLSCQHQCGEAHEAQLNGSRGEAGGSTRLLMPAELVNQAHTWRSERLLAHLLRGWTCNADRCRNPSSVGSIDSLSAQVSHCVCCVGSWRE